MYEIFMSVPKNLYQRQKKSMRLNGLVTSLILEEYFWHILKQIGERDGLTLGRLCSKLYDEFIQIHYMVDNLGFSSFLRVCCLRYVNLLAIGAAPKDTTISIASLDTENVLTIEKLNNKTKSA